MPPLDRAAARRRRRAASVAGSRIGPQTVLALGLVYVIWGSTYLAISVVVDAIPPLLAMGTRFMLAGVVLGCVLCVRRGPAILRVSRSELLAAWTVGALLMAGGNGIVAVAEQEVPSGIAALVIAATPLWIVLLRRLLGDRTRPLSLLGVVVGLAGVAVVVAPGGFTAGSAAGATAGSVLLLVLASLSWAAGSVAAPRIGLPRDPFVTAVHEMLGGGALMVVVGLARGEAAALDLPAVPASSWIGYGYLVLVGSLLGYTAYVWLLANAPLPVAATYAYVNPVVAVLLGALILGESVPASVLLGGGIVVAGVVLVVSAERPTGPTRRGRRA